MLVRNLLAGIASTALMASLCAAPTLATSGTPLTITLTRAPDFTEAGWSASGAINDAGAWTTDKGVSHVSPTAFIVAAVWTTQIGTAGTFRIRFQGIEGTPAGHPFGGTWTFGVGTGAYAGLQGGGTWSEADNSAGEHVFTVVGAVH